MQHLPIIRRDYGWLRVRLLGLAVLAAAVVAVPIQAGATSVVHKTVQDMTAGSTLVIQGVVIDIRQNQGSATGLPATKVTIAVDRVLKGFASAPTITISIPGGVRDGKVLRIPGMPAFEQGEEVVVFLERTPVGWIPSGLANGKFRIVNDDAGHRLAWRNAGNLNRVGINSSVTRSATVDSDLLTYDELVRMIDEGKVVKAASRRVTTPVAAPVSAVKGGAR